MRTRLSLCLAFAVAGLIFIAEPVADARIDETVPATSEPIIAPSPVAIVEETVIVTEPEQIEINQSEPAVPDPPSITTNSRWDRLAQCESGGNWSINTGNGFSGGIQFLQSTWLAMGGAEFAPDAWMASREQQIVIAERLLEVSGWGAWPGCSAKFGWL